MKNNAHRKGRGSNNRPASLSANSNSSTSLLIKAIRSRKLTVAFEILENNNVRGEFAILAIATLDGGAL